MYVYVKRMRTISIDRALYINTFIIIYYLLALINNDHNIYLVYNVCLFTQMQYKVYNRESMNNQLNKTIISLYIK